MHPSTDLITQHLDFFLEISQAHVYLKDRNNRYLDANQAMANLNKIEVDDFKGLTDRDLIWKNEASKMISNDAEIIYKDIKKTYLERSAGIDGNVAYYTSHKSPLRAHDGRVIGVIGISFPTEIDNYLLQPDHPIAEQLTSKQVNCLYYLVKGMSIKQIAQKVNLSPRTVEDHLKATKNKLNCLNRAELVAVALQIPIIRAGL